MSNQVLYSELLFDLPLVQQELLSGGINSDEENSSTDKFKIKEKAKDKDKNITNLFVFQKDITGEGEIKLNISM